MARSSPSSPGHTPCGAHDGCCGYGTLCKWGKIKKPNDIRLDYLKVNSEVPIPHYMFWPGNNPIGCSGKIMNGYVIVNAFSNRTKILIFVSIIYNNLMGIILDHDFISLLLNE